MSTLPHSVRRGISAVLVAVLLLVQFATLAYACDALRRADVAPAAAHSLPPCHGAQAELPQGVPAEQAGLCQQHCQFGDQLGEPRAKLDMPALAWVVLPLPAHVPAVADAVLLHRSVRIEPPSWPGSPPPAILFGNFRS